MFMKKMENKMRSELTNETLILEPILQDNIVIAYTVKGRDFMFFRGYKNPETMDPEEDFHVRELECFYPVSYRRVAELTKKVKGE